MNIESLNGKYRGERIFLVGNGPSLDDTPLNKLTDEYTFAMNKIHKIYQGTEWRPSFYFFGHHDMNPEKKRYVQRHVNLGIPCFINSNHHSVFGDGENIYYFDKHYLKEGSTVEGVDFHQLTPIEVSDLPLDTLEGFWSNDVTEQLITYHSMYGVIQLASYMGFDKMYLIGCDLGDTYHAPHMIFESGLDPLKYENDHGNLNGYASFVLDGLLTGTPIRSIINGISWKALQTRYYYVVGTLLSKIGLLNDEYHFSDDYIHQPRDMSVLSEELTKSHIAANRMSKTEGFEIYNATVGGNLEVYERKEFDQVLD